MSLSDRRAFLLFLSAGVLSGCGFQPVYTSGGAATAIRGQVRTKTIQGRDGFELVGRLDARLDPPGANARYLMSVDLTVTEEDLILDVTNGITRYTLVGIAKVSVTDTSTSAVVFQDKLRDTVGYSGTSETVQTEAAERDAHRRLMVALADQIVLRLTSTASSWTT